MSGRKWIGWALRLVGPILLVIVLVRLPEPRQLGAVVAASDPLLLAGSALFNFASIHIKVVRWQVLLRVRGIHYSTKQAWLAFSSSMYLSLLTPGRVGDVLRVQYLRHDVDAPYAEGLASIVMDRLCDLYVLAAFVSISIVHYSGVLGRQLQTASVVVVVATVLGPLVLLVPGVAERVVGVIYKRVTKDPTGRDLAVFLDALRAQVGRPLLSTIPLTVAAFLVNFFQAWLVARGLGLSIGYFDVVCLTAVASLLGLLPISISGMGVREALFATVFPSFGYTKEQAVAFGLLVFAVIYLTAAIMGFVTWQMKPPPTGAAAPPR